VASFTVKQAEEPPAPEPASSFGIRTLAASPVLQPDPSSNHLQEQTTSKPFTRLNEATVGDPSVINCQQDTSTVETPTTPNTIVILGESSFARQSKLAPQPYLPPPESPSVAPTFLQPLKLSLPLKLPTKKPESTSKPDLETHPKPSATFVQSESILPSSENKPFRTTTEPPLISSPKSERPLFVGQAANVPESVIPTDNEVDNCKHSFHSFLCTSSSSSRSRRPFNISRPLPISPLTGDSSFENPTKLLPPVAQPASQKTIKPTAKDLHTKPKPVTQRPATTLRPVLSTTDPKLFAEAAQSPVQVTALQDKKQLRICDDAFHSFLCQPINTSRRRQKYGERYQNSAVRIPATSAPLRGDSSFIQPSKILLNSNQPRTNVNFTAVSNTSLPPLFTTGTGSTPQEPVTSCNHTKTPTTTSRPYVTASNTPTAIPALRPDSTFIQAAKLPYPQTLPNTTRATSRVSRPQTSLLNVPAAQTPDVSIVRPDNDHSHDHSHDHGHEHDHHGIDICKDPFHSFLCTPVIPSKRRRLTGGLPERFRNPVPPNFLGASSFNQPTKIFPPDTKAVTSRPPPATTKSSFQEKKPIFSSQQRDIQQKPAQTTLAKLLPRPTTQIRSKSEHSCKQVFHTFLCEEGGSKTTFKAQSSPLPPSKLVGDSSFVNPSKVLPSLSLNAQSTENQGSIQGYAYPKPSPTQQTTSPIPTTTHQQGYAYNPPYKPLQYPASTLKGESTILQPLKTFASNNLTGQSTENRASSSGFKEFPGYNYQKPLNPLRYPTTTTAPSSTIIHDTVDNISGQGTRNQGNYKPPPNQLITTLPPAASGYKHPTPAKPVQYPYPLQTPLTSTQIGTRRHTEARKTLPLVSENGSAKNSVSQRPPSNDPFSAFRQPDDQLRAFETTDAATHQKPLCDHSLPQGTPVQTPQSSALPSPSEFVRGPAGVASVLAASNELPDKCNHPFLGYVCKRSSDSRINKNK